MRHFLEGMGSRLLSLFAGISAFALTLIACVMLQGIDQQIVGALVIGLFALLVVWIASEKPNSGHARAVRALIDRLMAVREGDYTSSLPIEVRREIPTLAGAVDELFTQVRSSLDIAQAQAMYDPVTSLPNRVHFRREAELLLAGVAAGDCSALLFLDLDGFKDVNDSLGHAVGDKVLAIVAERLRDVVRERSGRSDGRLPLVARLAGDEFTLMFPSVKGAEEAEDIARRLLVALGETYDVAGQRVDMGASIGIALAPEHGRELTGLMKAADIAMYHAKASGRSQVCRFDGAMAAAAEIKVQKERALREALQRDEFMLAFQPILCARTGDVVAGEALIRWHHPDGRLRYPDSFIAAAEESRLIVDIGAWVIETASRTLGRWQTLGHGHRLAMNVSPRQIEHPTFFRSLREALDRNALPPWLLELEFTESVAMKCSTAVVAELAALRERGVSIAIDDFGTGYSNLARIREMPLDRVKIDRSLVKDIDRSESARTVITAVVHLIHSLGCEAVGKGVERKEQIEVLRAIGCDALQGFVFAPAMPEAEFLDWVARRRPSQAELLSRSA